MERPLVERVRQVDAVPLLAANTYRNELLDAAMRAQEFESLTRLVSGVPVLRLSYPVGLEHLTPLCEQIENARVLRT